MRLSERLADLLTVGVVTLAILLVPDDWSIPSAVLAVIGIHAVGRRLQLGQPTHLFNGPCPGWLERTYSFSLVTGFEAFLIVSTVGVIAREGIGVLLDGLEFGLAIAAATFGIEMVSSLFRRAPETS